MRLITAPACVVSADTVLGGGGVVIDGGRIVRVVQSRQEGARLARDPALLWTDCPEGVLAPVLVNAHCHLELTALGGQPAPEEGGFRAWIERLLPLRGRMSAEDLLQSTRTGAQVLLASGTGLVGDIDTSRSTQALDSPTLRRVVYREALDAGDEARIPAVLDGLQAPWERTDGLREGLSPHAPFTVSPALLRQLGDLARRFSLPLAIHWAETREEEQLLREGLGSFVGFVQGHAEGCAGPGGLERLEAAGLVGPTTALIHGNHPGPGERERIAQAGSTVVHCPGSHAYFDREPFDLEAYRQAGVPVALGTDSAASNAELDMRRELQLLRAQQGVSPSEAWRMATENGARALGAEGKWGRLQAGYRADLALFAGTGTGSGASWQADQILAGLTDARPALLDLWLDGRRLPAVVPKNGRRTT